MGLINTLASKLLGKGGESPQLEDGRFNLIESEKAMLRQIAREYQTGFPTLARAYDDYFTLLDNHTVDRIKALDTQKFVVSEIIDTYAAEKRAALFEKRIFEYLVSSYESLYPILAELRTQALNQSDDERVLCAAHTAGDLPDAASLFLSREEYRKLPPQERNQWALDRYREHASSPWHLDNTLLRYIGYQYEMAGYAVNYSNTIEGLGVFGSIIIATKGTEVIIAQGKQWSSFTPLHERLIFNFCGDAFQFFDEHKDKNVRAVFYSPTTLPDRVRKFCKQLGVDLEEEFTLDAQYPDIKCLVSKDNSHNTYFLPLDNEYDSVSVNIARGDRYFRTIAEAERAGFEKTTHHKKL